MGLGDADDRSSPTQVPGLLWSATNTQAGGAGQHSGLVRNDGTLWTMGRNFQGALGHGDKQDYNSPRQVPGTTWVGDPVIAMNAAQYRKSDGTLWVCGNNPNGELGQNNVTGYSSPKQIPGTTWASGRNKGLVSEVHMVALKTDGTVWSWGRNQYGQLGLNQDYSGQRSSPTQIGTDTTWNAVSGSRDGWNIATKTDGTMWAWGYGAGGILAQNNTTNYISPVQIPGTTWSTKFAAGRLVLAVKTDGTLWSWGNNYFGNQGQSDKTQRSSPTQVGTDTNWSIIGRTHHLREA